MTDCASNSEVEVGSTASIRPRGGGGGGGSVYADRGFHGFSKALTQSFQQPGRLQFLLESPCCW